MHPTGFASGSVNGAVSGLVGGLIGTTGNDLMNGKTVFRSLISGFRSGVSSWLLGSITGGIRGGIQAAINGRKFLTGNIKKIKIPAAYYADVDASVGNVYEPNAFGSGYTPYLQNRSGHDVFYRAEDGLTGLTNLPDGYYLDAPIDGVATFKSISTDRVYKIPNGGRISIL